MTEEIIRAAGELMGYGMVLGFAIGAFLTLATAGLCSVVHMLKHAMS